MEKLILYYHIDGDDYSDRITQPFYYSSPEAAMVHFMDKVRATKIAYDQFQIKHSAWLEQFTQQKKNVTIQDRPEHVSGKFEFAGRHYDFYNFIKTIEATAYKKEYEAEDPPSIYTIEEYFNKYSSNKA